MQFFVLFVTVLLVVLRVTPLFSPQFEGTRVRVSGPVVNQPTESFGRQTVRLGTFVARVQASNISYGDYISVEGYYRDGLIEDADVREYRQENNIFKEVHRKAVSVVNNSLPSPHSGLVAGVVLGDKEGISKEYYELFKLTGTAHVVVASGMNVTLVAGFALTLLVRFINRRRAVLLSIVLIWMYVFISGVAAPIVRAGIMATIAFSSQAVGRMNASMRALLVSLVIMLLIYPWWVFDIGLWLSFAATLSLMLFSTKVDRKLQFVPSFLREGLSTSLAAQVGVTPILLFYFGQISLIGPLVNALVLWTVTPLMIIGLLGILIGMFVPVLGTLILYLCLPLTTWFYLVIDIFS
jgi:competence protein ComEC